MHCVREGISGRGFLGLSQNGVSAHEFYSEPSAVSSSEEESVGRVMTNLVIGMIIVCGISAIYISSTDT